MSSCYVELDEIFRRYAYKILQQRVNWFRRWLMEEDEYVCEVDWDYLTLEHRVVKFQPQLEEGEVMETNWGNVQSGAKWVSLWSCDFDNKADGKQSHTFRGSRDTTTWVDVDLKQYYTINKEPSININLPPTFNKMRAGRDNTLSVNKTKGQIFKEMLTWEVNSQVEVVPGWKAHAELLAKEESYKIDFEVRTTLYNPKGVVPVSFKKKSDGKLAYLVNIHDFQEAFKPEEEGGSIRPGEKTFVEFLTQVTDQDGEEGEPKVYPQMVTQGSMNCLCWSDQKVDIRTAPLTLENANHSDGDRTSAVLRESTSHGVNYSNSFTEKRISMKRTIVH